MHVPHDIEPKNQQRLTLLASSRNDDVAEESSDRLGALVVPESDDKTSPTADTKTQQVASSSPLPNHGGALANVSATTGSSAPPDPSSPPTGSDTPQTPAPASDGTVVLNVDSGIIVPSFVGKSLRSAVEYAQQTGFEINVLGSGIARQQSPPPGAHLLAGQRVTVHFSH
jgi:PASTA domain